MNMPSSFAELIDLWPSVAEFARETDQPYERVKQWRLNDSIPPIYWPSVLNAGARLGVPKLSPETLMALAVNRGARRSEEQGAA